MNEVIFFHHPTGKNARLDLFSFGISNYETKDSKIPASAKKLPPLALYTGYQQQERVFLTYAQNILLIFCKFSYDLKNRKVGDADGGNDFSNTL